MIFSCNNIKKSYGAKEVLKGVSFILEERDKLALIGINGAGKTTLFRIILGTEAADEGDIILKKSAKVAYLLQHFEENLHHTIYEELLMVFEHIRKLEQDMRALEASMANLKGNELETAMNSYAKMNQTFEAQRGYECESRAKGVLKGLGFKDNELGLPIKNLSGGQKTRVSLGKILLSEPELLLLDEPTNHLDINAITWLEDYLSKEYKKAVIIISHDRYFIDKVCSKVVEIEHGLSRYYNGNYSFYVDKKAADYEIELKHFESQQKEIKKQEESIALLRRFGREKHIKRAKSKEKQLAKVERIDKPPSAPDKMRLYINPRIQSGNDVLDFKGLSKYFGDYKLFGNADMNIRRGEVIALIGDNGVGKTTLFNMIRGKDDAIKFGTNVKIGYYDQHMDDLNHNKTIMEEISDAEPRLKNSEIRNILACFLFVGDDVFKSISSLSGGEKGRVALAKLMLSDANFLMLDEPTNHLDLFSKEILENALLNYSGTTLYISHDRYFINNTAEKIYELKASGTTLYLGDYDYYIEKRKEKAENGQAKEISKEEPKNDYLSKKALESEARKKETRIKRLEQNILNTETEIGKLNDELAKEKIYTNYVLSQEIYEQRRNLEDKLESMYEEFAELTEGL